MVNSSEGKNKIINDLKKAKYDDDSKNNSKIILLEKQNNKIIKDLADTTLNLNKTKASELNLKIN